VAALHRRASQWYEQAGEASQAIRHRRRRGPVGPPEGTVVLDERELARLPGVIEMYRAALALVRGDPPTTVEHARRAISPAAAEDDLTRAGASAVMGLALWGGGDLEAAHRAYAVAAEGLGRVGYVADVLGCSITLADIRITRGRLREALRTYERALRLAASEDGVVRGTADMQVGMSQIARERDDLPAALRHLRRAEELGEHTWLPQNPYRTQPAEPAADQARGDVPGALPALERALTLAELEGYVRMFAAEGPPMASLLRRIPRQRATWDYVRRLLAACGRVGATPPGGGRPPRPASASSSPERARAGRAPAARLRPRRPRHRPRAHGLPEHPADPHQEHLRQAGRQSRRAAVRQAAELNLLSRARGR
jgi:tetratricopeptide (TPR) repeat protein